MNILCQKFQPHAKEIRLLEVHEFLTAMQPVLHINAVSIFLSFFINVGCIQVIISV